MIYQLSVAAVTQRPSKKRRFSLQCKGLAFLQHSRMPVVSRPWHGLVPTHILAPRHWSMDVAFKSLLLQIQTCCRRTAACSDDSDRSPQVRSFCQLPSTGHPTKPIA
jgi:hypothetical protein